MAKRLMSRPPIGSWLYDGGVTIRTVDEACQRIPASRLAEALKVRGTAARYYASRASTLRTQNAETQQGDASTTVRPPPYGEAYREALERIPPWQLRRSARLARASY